MWQAIRNEPKQRQERTLDAPEHRPENADDDELIMCVLESMIDDVRPGDIQQHVIKMGRLQGLEDRIGDQEDEGQEDKVIVDQETIHAFDANTEANGREYDA
jgi:hypothetical protein